MERLVYVVEGGDSGWRIGYQHAPMGKGGPWMREGLWKPASPAAPPIYCRRSATSRTARRASPTTRAPASHPKYAGHFFITHFKGSIARSGIQTYTLKQSGATFAPTSSQQFIGGVLPTDVTFGPDGKLYISRLGRWLAEVEQGPHLRHLAGEAGSGAGQDQRRPRQTTGRRASEEIDSRNCVSVCCRIPTGARASRRSSSWRRGATSSVKVFTARGRQQGGQARWRACTRSGGSRSSARKNARSRPDTLVKLLRRQGPGSPRAGGEGPWRHQGRASRRHAFVKKLARRRAARAVLRRAELGKLEDARIRRPLLALLRTNDNKDAVPAPRGVRTRWPKHRHECCARRRRQDPSAAVRLGVVLAYRELRDATHRVASSTTRTRYVVREAAEAINDAPIEAGMRRARGETRQCPGERRAAGGARINANIRLGDAPPTPRRWRNTPLQWRQHRPCAPRRCTQLGLWGKVPQRDRIVGIFRPLNVRREPSRRSDALTPVVAARCWARHRKPCSSPRSKPSAILQLREAAPDAGGDRGERQGTGSRASRCAQGARRLGRRMR